MKKFCLILITVTFVTTMFLGCASKEEMDAYYKEVYKEETASAPRPSPTPTPSPVVKVSRQDALQTVQNLDIGDTNIKDSGVDSALSTSQERIFKMEGDLYNYLVSEVEGKLRSIEIKEMPESFDVNVYNSQEENLPIAKAFANKIVPEFDLNTLQTRTKNYKVGKGDTKDLIRTYYQTDFYTLVSDVDIKHGVSVVTDQNGRLMSLKANYNPNYTPDNNIKNISYEQALEIAQKELMALDAENYDSYTLASDHEKILTIYDNDKQNVVWEFKYNNPMRSYYIFVIDAESGEILQRQSNKNIQEA